MDYRKEAIECVKDHVLPLHKQIYAKYDGDFDRIYSEGYNSKSYQGRVIEPGKVYELSYSECSCPKVKCGLRSNSQQCECSRQSILYVLSQLEPDSQFDVRIENTILRGGDRCTFRITRRAGVKRQIAVCGLDCEKCDAYIATKNNDQTLREKTAKLWSEMNNTTILPEQINCEGCRMNGKKFVYCESMCGIRKCAISKGYETCGDCLEMDTCQTLGAVTVNCPEALKNLRNKEYGNNDQIMNIHLIEKNEREEALQLVKEVFMEFEAPDYCDEGIADFMHAISDESYLNMHHFYGAYQENKLVGVIATRNDHHHIGLLFVYKNYQRKGIGRQLIQHILTLKDETPITVNASPYGHEFYKKLGFVDTSDEQITNGVRYYPMKRK